MKEIKARVSQGSVLGPVLYPHFTRDVPKARNTVIAMFADDTAILSVGNNIGEATNRLQIAVNKISNWAKRWRIKLNESKSVQVNYTNRKIKYLLIKLNKAKIPHVNMAKYLGMNLDALRWKEHIKKKMEELRLKYRKMYWLDTCNCQYIINCCYISRY